MLSCISGGAKGNAVVLHSLAKSLSTFQVGILHSCNFEADVSQKSLKKIDILFIIYFL